MNKQIAENINVIIENLIKASEIAVDFGKEQVPLLIQEILNYNLVISGFWSMISFFILLYSTLAIKRVFCTNPFKSEENLDILTISLVTGLPSFVVFVVNFPEFLKLFFAPRLFLLEYLKNFM